MTVTAVTPGTTGNSITLAETLANFAWGAGGVLAGGANGQNTIMAFNNLYSGPEVAADATGTFTGDAGTGTITITNGTKTLTLTQSGANSGSCTVIGDAASANFKHEGNTTNEATSLRNLINATNCGSNVGVSATSSAAVVTVTATTPGPAGNSIALAKTVTVFAWSGSTFVGGKAAGLCGSGQPTLLWSYNTGGAVLTSPVLSLDGTKVAFIENASPPKLHVLTMDNSGSAGCYGGSPCNGTSAILPVVPGTANTAVDTTLTFGLTGNTGSSLFVNYLTDEGYAGDNNGVLHKFNPVFIGAPAEVAVGWPVTVSSTHALNSPVLGFGAKNIFVGDNQGFEFYVMGNGSTTGTCQAGGSAPCLGHPTGATAGTNHVDTGINALDAALVDNGTGKVHVFQGQGAINGTNVGALIWQFDTQLSVCSSPAYSGANNACTSVTAVAGGTYTCTTPSNPCIAAEIGAKHGAKPTYHGHFDNAYISSNIPTQAGYLYACGKGASDENANLYRIGFDATTGKMNTTTDSGPLALSSVNTTSCSPLTEVFNGSTDFLFAGVTASCTLGGDALGCVMAFDITSGFPSTAATAAEAGGASGIIVDNVGSGLGNQFSNVYFSTLGNATCSDGITAGGCAVKRTQAELK
ncbi:MAG: hypothetical protein HY236_17130 [Acidobacteria bacterium]|nr:hypothetical protein [Acidobacteriota bacterium]